MRFGTGLAFLPAKIESRVIDDVCRIFPRWKQEIMGEIDRIGEGLNIAEYERLTIVLDSMCVTSEKSHYEELLEMHGFPGLLKKQMESENSPGVALMLVIVVIFIAVGLYAYYHYLRISLT